MVVMQAGSINCKKYHYIFYIVIGCFQLFGFSFLHLVKLVYNGTAAINTRKF